MTLIWSKKRYSEDGGLMPCDPILAKNGGVGKPQEFGGSWLPYNDSEGNEIGF